MVLWKVNKGILIKQIFLPFLLGLNRAIIDISALARDLLAVVVISNKHSSRIPLDHTTHITLVVDFLNTVQPFVVLKLSWELGIHRFLFLFRHEGVVTKGAALPLISIIS